MTNQLENLTLIRDESKPTRTLIVLCVFFLSFFPQATFSQIFDFTFDRLVGQESAYFFNCGGGMSGFGCTGPSGDDGSRFLQASNVLIDGESYFHQIVTDEASGFSQEIFLLRDKMGPQCAVMSCITDGSPTQNPTGVAMKQVITETSGSDSFYDEFLKDQLDNKAKTLQQIVSSSIDATFSNDARNQSLTVMPTESVPVTNTITITAPDIPTSTIGPGLDFDMSTDSDVAHSTGSSYFYDEINDRYEYIAF